MCLILFFVFFLEGGKKKVWKRNRKVLQLPGEAFKFVGKEEGASAARGIYLSQNITKKKRTIFCKFTVRFFCCCCCYTCLLTVFGFHWHVGLGATAAFCSFWSSRCYTTFSWLLWTAWKPAAFYVTLLTSCFCPSLMPCCLYWPARTEAWTCEHNFGSLFCSDPVASVTHYKQT